MRRTAATNISPLTPADLSELRRIVETRTGLLISARKDREILTRIGGQLEDLGGGVQFMKKLGSSERFRQQVVNNLTIGESYFFRNHPHFTAMREKIIPAIIDKKKDEKTLRIWSAGCSTGEEPYSVAMMLDQDFPSLVDWDVQIMATDLNTEYLKRAKSGIYGSWSFRGVDEQVLRHYFKKTTNDRFKIDKKIRKRVSFKHLNLSLIPSGLPPELQDQDLILCRNVLIYFSSKLANQICHSYARALTRHGHLILGHSESFPNLPNMETVYSHATYYYRRTDGKKRATGRAHSLSLVPGIGEHNTAKMISRFKAEPAKAPAKTVAKKKAAEQVPSRPAINPAEAMQSGIDNELQKIRDFAMEGEIAKAESALVHVERQGKPDYRIFYLRALVADQNNETEDALAYLKKSIFVNKDFIIGHYYQAVISERSGDTRTAKRSYKNAMNLAQRLSARASLPEGGGITAGRLVEIAGERLKELEL